MAKASAPRAPKKTPREKTREWFSKCKFGMFIHWGVYAVLGKGEWIRTVDQIPQDEYAKLPPKFNPTKFDPGAWADLAKRAGMKYMVVTTKHHDGFCMFDTKTTDYRITHPSCPFHADPRANVLAHVFDAFKARDFGISCYFSKSDWHCPWYWLPDRPALCGILYVLKTGLHLRMRPQELGCGSGVTCWRRLRDWQAAGVWQALHRVLLDRLGAAGRIDWSRASVDSASVRAKGGGRRPAPTRPTARNPAPSTISSSTARASPSPAA